MANPYFIQGKLSNVSTTGTTLTTTLTSAPAASSIILAFVLTVNTATVSSVKDGNGVAYQLVIGPIATTTEAASCYAGPVTGSSSVTAIYTSSTFAEVGVVEYGNAANYPGLAFLNDAAASATGNSATPSVVVTVPNASETVVSYVAGSGVSACTAGAGLTKRVNSTFDSGIGDAAMTASGSFTVNWNVTSGIWVVLGIPLKPSLLPSNVWGGGTGGALVY